MAEKKTEEEVKIDTNKQEKLKEVLSTITARIPVANIEVKSNKLAYLLAHLKQQEVQQ